jgi:hypothetical protein
MPSLPIPKYLAREYAEIRNAAIEAQENGDPIAAELAFYFAMLHAHIVDRCREYERKARYYANIR